jgi:50S ribosomal protein L16 3-hydroxylase
MPAALQGFARKAVEAALRDADAVDRALGESLTEPKANVWFGEGGEMPEAPRRAALDRRTRMLYDIATSTSTARAFAPAAPMPR